MLSRVKTYLKNYKKGLTSGTHFFKTIDETKNDVCFKYYAVHVLKNKPYEIQEVYKEYLNKGLYVSGNVNFYCACGYRVDWKGDDYKFYKIDKRLNIWAMPLFTIKEASEILKKHIPYFQVNDCVDIYNYAKNYKDYAMSELLSKAGFDYLVLSKRILKLNKDKKKALISWLKVNGDYVRKHTPLVSYILKAVNHNITIEQVYYEEAIDVYEKEFKKNNIVRTRKECEETYKYLNSSKKVQNIGLHDYIDYLNMAKECGYDMTARSTLFPLNAREKHDLLQTRIKLKKGKAISRKIKKIHDLLKSYELSYKDLSIVIPKSQVDFIKWGKLLNICVGSYGYDKKMADRRCIIIGIKNKGKVIECCEIGGKAANIIQLRGKDNCDSDRHDDCLKLANKFITKFRKEQLYDLE